MTVKEYFDILFVVPLEEEYSQVADVFRLGKNRSTDSFLRFEVETGAEGLRGLLVQQSDMGKDHAATAVREVLADFDIGFIICIGIAGSLTDDLRLADVCYSGTILDITENVKAEDVEHGVDLFLSPNYYETPKPVTANLNFIRTFPELRELYSEWENACFEHAAAILPDPIIERGGKERIVGSPRSKNGTIACGVVTKSKTYNEKVRAVDRRVLAIETESGGIFEEGRKAGISCLTVRGISDHADKNKSKLEHDTGSKVRVLAAANAARFVKYQFRNPYFLSIIERTRRDRQLPLDLEAKPITSPTKSVASIVATISSVVDERLRELSPEFRLQARGYRLPVPRMREVHYDGGLQERFASDPVEIREALSAEDVVLLSMARNYPDHSLPWVLASDLLTSEIAGKQCIPVVIDGLRMRPPGTGLNKACDYQYEGIESHEGIQIVYIIDELPFTSRTKINFIVDEIKSNKDAKYIVISRNETNIIAESDFAGRVGAANYQLASVSFQEIAYFVQKNFEISPVESEVLALRLRDTFEHFDLSAHPTYFAGISKDVLVALLQANQRAELIQLAVDGFLSFVVAGDTATVRLSRTTRTKFLRTIASAINIRGEQIDQAGLVGMARDLAQEHNFEIDPIAFVASFVDAGILHFDEGNARFSLTFIESYLLALELVEDPAKAKQYFSLDNKNFNMSAFDLYSELGASESVVEHVILAMEVSIADFELQPDETHFLLSDQMRPRMLSDLTRLNTLTKTLDKTVQDVKEGKGDVKRKQVILDTADQVRESATDKSSFSGRVETPYQAKVRNAVTRWVVGTTLLGAGAESLKGETKEKLASLVVRLAAVILHHWTKSNAKVNFQEIKDEITAEKFIEEVAAKREPDVDRLELKKFLGSLVDLLEFAFLAEPFGRLMGHLSESARQRVLAASVAKAEIDGQVDALVHATWLCDIDSERGKKMLVDRIKELPLAPFLRVVLATHLMLRVHWNHWKKEDRLTLLDAAAEVIKPITQLDKGKLRRLIGKDSERDPE